jgi:hypothetical protein
MYQSAQAQPEQGNNTTMHDQHSIVWQEQTDLSSVRGGNDYHARSKGVFSTIVIDQIVTRFGHLGQSMGMPVHRVECNRV